MERTRARAIAETIGAMRQCGLNGNDEWRQRHHDTLMAISRDLPHGSGVDNGTTIDIDRCDMDRIVLTCDYHHMDEHGYYSHWTSHEIIVTPTFAGIDVDVTDDPDDDPGTADYLADLYHAALSETTIL